MNCIWVCYHLSAQLSACYRFQCYTQCKCVITSTVCELVITYQLNWLCVTAFSVTCSVKCVITSNVYGCVISYELNCLRVTTSSVTWRVSVLSLQRYIGVLSFIMRSTVCVLPLSVLHAV